MAMREQRLMKECEDGPLLQPERLHDRQHALDEAAAGFTMAAVPAVARALERLLQDAGARALMARRGPEVVDGLGTARVVRELQDADVWLRPVRADDCRLIWEWANEPAVRAASFTTEAIPWERHEQWFAARFNDPDCAFFIGLNGRGVPIGQVRGDVSGSLAVISISLDPRFRGSGYGTKLIRKGSETLLAHANVDRIHAFVRRENDASRKAFEKAGFNKVEDTIVHGHAASLLVLRK